MPELANVGEYCPYGTCPDAGNSGSSAIIKYGRTPNGRQRYQCKTCKRTFSENTGTIFFKKHTPADQIVETLAFVAEGSRVASLTRVKGFKKDTIRNWLQQAAEHATAVEDVLMREYRIEAGQLDGMWTYVGRKTSPEEPGTEEPGTEEPATDSPGVSSAPGKKRPSNRRGGRILAINHD
jgi:transposase-like protein